MMKKETVVAFSILLAGFWFFNSKIYYKILGQPYPYGNNQTAVSNNTSVQEIIQETVIENVESVDTFAVEDKDLTELDSIGEKVITISNSLLELNISDIGAKIISAKTLKYNYGKGLAKEGNPVELISDGNIGILTAAIGNVDLSNTRFIYDENNSNGNAVKFDCFLNGEKISKIFELSDDSYYINFEVQSNLIKKETVSISLDGGVCESESDNDKSILYSERAVSIAKEKHKTERLLMKKVETTAQTGQFDWVALNSKYFVFAVIPQDKNNRDLNISSYLIDETAKIEPINFNYRIEIAKKAVKNGQNEDFVKYSVFLGPAKHSDLTQAKTNLERTLFRGYAWFFGANLWFPPLCEAVLWFLNFFGKLIKDYGISIILLTLLLKVITYPLSQSSMNSMAAMQVLQPKIQSIQKKYADNKHLQQQKILELYQSEGINPLASLGGCIPVLVQMPIMISLFIVLRKAVELRGEVTFLLPWIQDLSQAEILFKLPFTIPFYGDNFAVLPILMAGLMFLQNKMTIKDPNQAAMVYLMPVIMLVMFNNFPAGLTLYFTLSNLLQIIQQKFFTTKPMLSAKVQTIKAKK
jgi:YidC/Oxa1 family membrane protein insertase